MATMKCSCGQPFALRAEEIGRPVTCPTCGRESVAVDADRPAEPIRRPQETVVVPCQLCGRGGAEPVELMRVVSALLITWPRRWHETLCPMCARRRLLLETMITTFLGWWGIPLGLMYTPVALIVNGRSMARHSDFPGPFGVMATVLVAAMPLILLAFGAGWFPEAVPPAAVEKPADSLSEQLAARARNETAAGRHRDAAALYDELLRRAPDWPGAAAAAGEAYLRAGRNADAVKALRASGDPAGRRLLAEALLALGRPEDAHAELVDETVEVRACALVRLGEYVRAARLEPAGPRSSVAITRARLALGAPDWAGAARSATVPEARVVLFRALGCMRAAERISQGDDAAWLALDRGDLAGAMRQATSSPWGAVANGLARRLLGEPVPAEMAPGDGDPFVRLIARALVDPVAFLILTQPVPGMTDEERWAADLVLAVSVRDVEPERARRILRRAQLIRVETRGRILAAWLLGEAFDDPLGRQY